MTPFSASVAAELIAMLRMGCGIDRQAQAADQLEAACADLTRVERKLFEQRVETERLRSLDSSFAAAFDGYSEGTPAEIRDRLYRAETEVERWRTVIALIGTWTHEYGAALCPCGADTYGNGMRDAKQQVAQILQSRAELLVAKVRS